MPKIYPNSLGPDKINLDIPCSRFYKEREYFIHCSKQRPWPFKEVSQIDNSAAYQLIQQAEGEIIKCNFLKFNRGHEKNASTGLNLYLRN